MNAQAPAGLGQHPRRVAWPVADWPAADRHAWTQALTAGGLLDDAGASADWRPATQKSAIGGYGRYLAYLAAQGLLDAAAGPEARATPVLLAGYATALATRCSSVTVASYLGVLGMMLPALLPGRDWGWLWQLHARLQRRAVPSRDKRARIVPVTDLWQLGLDLMAGSSPKTDWPTASRAAALAYRDGLMIALLASRPLRQKNFLAIETGRQLRRDGAGWRLCFAVSETKTHRALEMPLPEALQDPLAVYLEQVRPRLLALGHARCPGGTRVAAGSRLWLTGDGTPCSAGALQKLLAKRTAERFGKIINPHLFRDCAATSIARDDPEHVRIAAQLLGHESLRTSERHYIVADTRTAVGRHHDLVQALRTGKPGSASRASGRGPA